MSAEADATRVMHGAGHAVELPSHLYKINQYSPTKSAPSNDSEAISSTSVDHFRYLQLGYDRGSGAAWSMQRSAPFVGINTLLRAHSSFRLQENEEGS